MTIANMAIEAGGKNAIFEFDSRTAEYVDARVKLNGTKSAYEPVEPDKDQKFVYELVVDLSKLEPTVACHPDPGQRKKAKDMGDTKLDRAYVGSCTGGKTSDFVEFARVLRGKRVTIDTFGVPATPDIVHDLQSTRWGGKTIWEILVDAGVQMTENAGCAACLGGPVDTFGRINKPGIKCISATNRNFPGPHGRQGKPGVSRVADDRGRERDCRAKLLTRASIWGIELDGYLPCNGAASPQSPVMRQRLWLLLLLPVVAGGCVTHKLWSEKTSDEWNEPAPSPNLRLFHDDRQNDFLVVYDEFSNRRSTTNTRAFFLGENQKRLTRREHPEFVSLKKSTGLTPLPVFSTAPTHLPNNYYALAATNGQSFSLFHGNRELGTHPLPDYNDGVGRWERTAWTPLTVTADLTIVGGVLALICWDALAESGTTVSVP